MDERKVPTEPGWWWRAVGDSRAPFTVEVFVHLGSLVWSYLGRDVWRTVTDDGCWLAPVASLEVVEALHAEVADLRRQLAEARDAEHEVRATHAAERGDPSGALPGWRIGPYGGERGGPLSPDVGYIRSDTGWVAMYFDGRGTIGCYRSAREAMMAADAAANAHRVTP